MKEEKKDLNVVPKPMKSNYLYLLDPGHGGIVDGEYVTPGKRSPKFDDGSVLYEGVNNRDNVKRILKGLKEAGIECIDIVDSNKDISLKERVKRANKFHAKRKCIYISIHSNGAGDGINWYNASGISVHTSIGQTESDKFGTEVINNLEKQFQNEVKWRQDTRSDGDKDKENNFYVLRKTTCPAILCELGFHTDKEEAKNILTEEWKNKVVKAIVDSVLAWEKIMEIE